MARDRSTVARAYLLSLLAHGALLSIPLPHGQSKFPGHAAPLQVRLTGAESVALAQTPGSVPTLPVPDVLQSVEYPETGAAGFAAGSGSDGAGLPTEPPKPPPIYRTASELHQRPIPLTRIDLGELARKIPGGQASFSVLIDEAGDIDAIAVRDGSPALLEEFRPLLERLRFIPGKISGQAVKSELQIEIALPGSKAAPPQSGSELSANQVPSAAGN